MRGDAWRPRCSTGRRTKRRCTGGSLVPSAAPAGRAARTRAMTARGSTRTHVSADHCSDSRSRPRPASGFRPLGRRTHPRAGCCPTGAWLCATTARRRPSPHRAASRSPHLRRRLVLGRCRVPSCQVRGALPRTLGERASSEPGPFPLTHGQGAPKVPRAQRGRRIEEPDRSHSVSTAENRGGRVPNHAAPNERRRALPILEHRLWRHDGGRAPPEATSLSTASQINGRAMGTVAASRPGRPAFSGQRPAGRRADPRPIPFDDCYIENWSLWPGIVTIPRTVAEIFLTRGR
jgi:hypothetical protein